MVHQAWQLRGLLLPFLPPPAPNPSRFRCRPVPQHLHTREADGAGGPAKGPVQAGNRVPYEAAQHSVIQTQAAAGVVRHHFAEQVPGADKREVSRGQGCGLRAGKSAESHELLTCV